METRGTILGHLQVEGPIQPTCFVFPDILLLPRTLVQCQRKQATEIQLRLLLEQVRGPGQRTQEPPLALFGTPGLAGWWAHTRQAAP